jgi:hypothetical protein
MSSNLVTKKLERLKLLEEKQKLKEGLPHLHGHKMYQWQRDYFDSDNRYCFISAANQIGKSSISLRRAIYWATNTKLWSKLWPHKKPVYFMYFYPSLKLATREVETKWVPEFLPRGEFKEHPVYGWQDEYKAGEIKAIHFNSGVSILFMGYSQAATDLQAASPAAIYIDEEPPVEIIDELLMRIEGPNKGYFSMVATPTLGQVYFQEIFERKRMLDAHVQTISMYKCLQYEDGTPGPFTIADIKHREALLPTQAQIDMRIHGKFVKTEGLIYQSFDRDRNMIEPAPVPTDWLWYSGIDVGSGGSNHPAAIAFVAVSPDFKKARVVEAWRGSAQEVTTSEDILRRYLHMRGDRIMSGEYYDWAAKDFQTISLRAGIPIQAADKSQTTGQNLLNTLFKNQMLMIDDIEMNQPLVAELLNLRITTAKRAAVDDSIDSVRYAVTRIPFDFSGIRGLLVTQPVSKQPLDPRAEATKLAEMFDGDEIEAEIRAWNEIMEGY